VDRNRRPRTAVYAMLRKRYSMQALALMGFRFDSEMRFVKRGVCRLVLAEAVSSDGATWRVRPYVHRWR
jgi:hypothetical protein